MKHVRYQSVGNTAGIEETTDDFWEIDDDGRVVRSVHVQPDGSYLKYDESHDAARFGALPEGVITDEMLADRSLGKITVIASDAFDEKWSAKAKNAEQGARANDTTCHDPCCCTARARSRRGSSLTLDLFSMRHLAASSLQHAERHVLRVIVC